MELILARFRLDAVLDSDFRGTGPLEGGIASVRGLGAREALGGLSYVADEGSKKGVPFVETDGFRTAVSIRLGFGRSCKGAAASISGISSITPSGHSGPASCA